MCERTVRVTGLSRQTLLCMFLSSMYSAIRCTVPYSTTRLCQRRCDDAIDTDAIIMNYTIGWFATLNLTLISGRLCPDATLRRTSEHHVRVESLETQVNRVNPPVRSHRIAADSCRPFSSRPWYSQRRRSQLAQLRVNG